MDTAKSGQSYNWIGIDISKDSLDLYDLSEQHYTRYSNDKQGIEAISVHASEGEAFIAY